MKRVLLALLALIGVLLIVMWAFQRRLIYYPSTGPVPAADHVIRGARDVMLHTSDGLELGAWLVPARDPARDVTVLVASGNAGDRSARAPLAEALAAEGLSVLLFDYRGYGGNPGSPNEEGLARDARAAYGFLLTEEHEKRDRIIYFGESLGAAVVTELATEQPPAAMLLRSPFTDLAAVGRVHYPYLPVGLLLRDRYCLVEDIGSVRVPTTVVYGTHDSIVPTEQSRTVAAAVPGDVRVVEVEGADHNDIALLNGQELIEAVVDLADLVTGSD
jgi:pimeloyl-ACP methyl ester carboxylesterase